MEQGTKVTVKDGHNSEKGIVVEEIEGGFLVALTKLGTSLKPVVFAATDSVEEDDAED